LFELGKIEQAYKALDKARTIANQSKFDYVLFETDLFQAYFDFHQNNQEETTLQAPSIALANGRESKRVACAWWRADIMSPLCAEALKNGIETDYVTDIIRIRHLTTGQISSHPTMAVAHPYPYFQCPSNQHR